MLPLTDQQKAEYFRRSFVSAGGLWHVKVEDHQGFDEADITFYRFNVRDQQTPRRTDNILRRSQMVIAASKTGASHAL